MKSSAVRVMIADDHHVVREGLAALIDREKDMLVVAQAADGSQAVSLFSETRPDVTLMDLRMPDVDGVVAIETICRLHPDAKIIVLTTFDGDEDIYRGLSAGAKGFLLKDVEPDVMLEAIRAVHQGKKRVSSEAAKKLAYRAEELKLTERELDVLRLMAAGKTNHDIARALFIVEGTVKFHANNLFAKLGAQDRTQAVVVALRRGIIRLS